MALVTGDIRLDSRSFHHIHARKGWQTAHAEVELSRAEPGCMEYHMLRDAEDPALFILFEVWASAEAFAAHTALPHMQRFQEQRMDYLSQDFVIRPSEMLSDASASHH